jgi:hypothetical protein
MRRVLELMVLVGTAGILIATSQAPQQCKAETINLRAETTCGPVANLAVSSNTSCAVSAAGADFGGLPTTGFIDRAEGNPGLGVGFALSGAKPDAGGSINCDVSPTDGGFEILCSSICQRDTLAAGLGCEAPCSGVLIPQ